MWKRWIVVLLAVLMLPWQAGLALMSQEELEEHQVQRDPFVGHFEERRSLYQAPRTNGKVLVTIPAGISLWLTPITATIAETSYRGFSGYVLYEDALEDENADVEVLAYPVYAERVVQAYEQPHMSFASVMQYPTETPLNVIAENGAFLRIQTPDGAPQYIHGEGMLRPQQDKPMWYQAYLTNASVLLEWPLAGADVARVLPMSESLTVVGHNGKYAHVKTEKDTGYVLRSALSISQEKREAHTLACVTASTVVHSRPNAHAFTDKHIAIGTIVQVDGKVEGYVHVAEGDYYIASADVEQWKVEESKAKEGAWESPQLLYTRVGNAYVPTGKTLPANTPVDIWWTFGAYYCLWYEGAWGLAPKEGMRDFVVKALENPIPVIIPKGTALKERPVEGAAVLPQVMAEDTRFWVREMANGHAVMEVDGQTVFLEYDGLRQAGEVKKVSLYEVYVDTPIETLDFPDAIGRAVGQIPANTLVKVRYQNEQFALVQQQGEDRYFRLSDVKKMTDAELLNADTEKQKYYILVNKGKKDLTIYLADENGEPTDTVIRQTLVVIGRQSMPTPVGTFTLGKRQRWRYFDPITYGPFSIGFTARVCIHGPLHYSANEATVRKGNLKEWGMARTSGCIRVPYDDMLWIYTHCSGTNTILEVVNRTPQ